MTHFSRSTALISALTFGAALLLPANVVVAQEVKPTLSPGASFAPKDGRNLYVTVCQGCHMPNAKGAIGAGAYPALAGNKNIESIAYTIHVVVNGLKSMPPFGSRLNDEQVAAVVNYVRSNFSNTFTDTATAADVKIAR